MKNINLSVPDEEYNFFIELVKKLEFVKIRPAKKATSSKQEFLDGLKEAVDQVNLAKQGKIKLKSAEELLNEL